MLLGGRYTQNSFQMLSKTKKNKIIPNIEKIVMNEIGKDLDPLSRSMDASNG